MNTTAQAQRLFWGVNHGFPVGAIVDEKGGEYIPWDILKEEIYAIVHNCPSFIGNDVRVQLSDFNGKKDWVIEVVNESGVVVGSVWIGGDPEHNWAQDGLVRIGKTHSDTEHEVYQMLQRFSDGSYKSV